MEIAERMQMLEKWERDASQTRERMECSRQEALATIEAVDRWVQAHLPTLLQQVELSFAGRVSPEHVQRIAAEAVQRYVRPAGGVTPL